MLNLVSFFEPPNRARTDLNHILNIVEWSINVLGDQTLNRTLKLSLLGFAAPGSEQETSNYNINLAWTLFRNAWTRSSSTWSRNSSREQSAGGFMKEGGPPKTC